MTEKNERKKGTRATRVIKVYRFLALTHLQLETRFGGQNYLDLA